MFHIPKGRNLKNEGEFVFREVENLGEVGAYWANDVVKYFNENDYLKTLGKNAKSVCKELYLEDEAGKLDGKMLRKLVNRQIVSLNKQLSALPKRGNLAPSKKIVEGVEKDTQEDPKGSALTTHKEMGTISRQITNKKCEANSGRCKHTARQSKQFDGGERN